jgi:hypothetical protein
MSAVDEHAERGDEQVAELCHVPVVVVVLVVLGVVLVVVLSQMNAAQAQFRAPFEMSEEGSAPMINDVRRPMLLPALRKNPFSTAHTHSFTRFSAFFANDRLAKIEL